MDHAGALDDARLAEADGLRALQPVEEGTAGAEHDRCEVDHEAVGEPRVDHLAADVAGGHAHGAVVAGDLARDLDRALDPPSVTNVNGASGCRSIHASGTEWVTTTTGTSRGCRPLQPSVMSKSRRPTTSAPAGHETP